MVRAPSRCPKCGSTRWYSLSPVTGNPTSGVHVSFVQVKGCLPALFNVIQSYGGIRYRCSQCGYEGKYLSR